MFGLSIDAGTNNESRNELPSSSSSATQELETRVLQLREELRLTEAALEKELLEQESTDTTAVSSILIRPPVQKQGYLFKWMDRSIGWGGTKWALRFVALNQYGHLSYYKSHLDAQPRYVLSLRGCAIQDDGWKPNPRHRSISKQSCAPLEEPGAYFFIFSIYQMSDQQQQQQNDNIVPLLRFSTPSAAEKTLWIQRISEACAYCETEQWAAQEAARQAELEEQQRQQHQMALSMPEAKEGTLPPLYFAPYSQKRPKQYRRRPSFNKTPSAANFRTKSKSRNNGEFEKKTGGFPPSKPMHRKAEPSYLSLEAPVQNYRGLFNLGVIILAVSNIRLIMVSVKNHGLVIPNFLHSFDDWQRKDPWEDFPFITGFLLQVVFVLLGLGIELLIVHRYIPNTFGILLHHLNAHSAWGVPIYIVWNYIDKPAIGAILLLHATITWLKLLSYIHANEDYRKTAEDTSASSDSTTLLSLVENLDPSQATMRYPDNVTVGNIFYFWICPSLTYQIAFPRSPRVRLWKIVGILMRMVVCVTLFTFVAAQIVSPVLADLLRDLEGSHGKYSVDLLLGYWLRLAIANTYLWLLMFYFYFHLYLNLFAELLTFGDRVFYKDWWNSSEVSSYWRLWNMPVHYWLVRHFYFPCVRAGMSRDTAMFMTFLFSAVLHEVLVSIPFHMIRPWSFLGMMMQLPLVGFTKYLHKVSPGVGNMVFWLSFCVVGQPMAILLYTVDYQYALQHAALQECTA